MHPKTERHSLQAGQTIRVSFSCWQVARVAARGAQSCRVVCCARERTCVLCCAVCACVCAGAGVLSPRPGQPARRPSPRWSMPLPSATRGVPAHTFSARQVPTTRRERSLRCRSYHACSRHACSRRLFAAVVLLTRRGMDRVTRLFVDLELAARGEREALVLTLDLHAHPLPTHRTLLPILTHRLALTQRVAHVASVSWHSTAEE